MNTIDSIDPFRGTMYDAGLHNWLVNRRVNMPGIPCAVTVDTTHTEVGFDLVLAKGMDLVQTTSIGCMAAQGYGKTFWALIMALLGLSMDVGEGSARVSFPSLKHNKGRPETSPLLDLMGCKPILPKQVKLNPLARALGLTYEEMHTMVILMLQYVRGEKLDLYISSALNQELKHMYDDLSHEPSFPRLHELLKNYQFVVDENDNRRGFEREFRKGAVDLQLTAELFMTGLFGQLFAGDSTEIIELLKQPVVSWDFHGIEATERSVIEIVMNAINMSAILPDPNLKEGDEKYELPKHPERIPHYIFMDEAWSAWGNLEVAKAAYSSLKTQRSTGITTVMLFHRLADLQDAIGNDNSDQFKLARNAIREIEVWLIGRQHQSALASIREFFELPEYVIQSLTSLPKGHFWVTAPWEPAPFLVAIIGTRLEIASFNTDAANRGLLGKYFRTRKAKDYIDYLQQTTESPAEFDKKDPAHIAPDPKESPSEVSV